MNSGICSRYGRNKSADRFKLAKVTSFAVGLVNGLFGCGELREKNVELSVSTVSDTERSRLGVPSALPSKTET